MSFDIDEIAKESKSRDVGYGVVVHDPDPDIGHYIVGPFSDRDEAVGYGEGSVMYIGEKGSFEVYVMELPILIEDAKKLYGLD